MEETKRTENPWATPFREFTTAWTRTLELSFTAAATANRAALAAFPDGDGGESVASVGSPESARLPEPGRPVDAVASLEPAPVESLAYVESDWRVERSADAREDLSVGDYVRFTKPVTDDDVLAFAKVSGDTNRLHLDESFAEGTRFGGRIVHGALVAGLVSAALAALPGTVIYLSQELSFLAPAHVGDELTAECRIVEQLDDDRFRLSTTVRNPAGETLVEGDVTILVDPLPDDAGAPSGD